MTTRIIHSRNTKALEVRWPCVHLGDHLRDESSRTCGTNFAAVAVHHCNLLDVECARHRIFKRRQVAAIRHCLTCEHGPFEDLL